MSSSRFRRFDIHRAPAPSKMSKGTPRPTVRPAIKPVWSELLLLSCWLAILDAGSAVAVLESVVTDVCVVTDTGASELKVLIDVGGEDDDARDDAATGAAVVVARLRVIDEVDDGDDVDGDDDGDDDVAALALDAATPPAGLTLVSVAEEVFGAESSADDELLDERVELWEELPGSLMFFVVNSPPVRGRLCDVDEPPPEPPSLPLPRSLPLPGWLMFIVVNSPPISCEMRS